MRKKIKIRDANGNERIVTGDVFHIPSGETGATDRVALRCIDDTTIVSGAQILKNYYGYDMNGNRVKGTHECSGGGGGDEPNGWAIQAQTYSGDMLPALIPDNKYRIYQWMPEDTTIPSPYIYGAFYQVIDDSDEVYQV